MQGRLDEAIAQFTEALRIQPEHAECTTTWEWPSANRGRLDEAVAEFTEALRIQPDHVGARNNLTVAEKLRLERQGSQRK